MCAYHQAKGRSVTPPCFTVDLSMPPEERYKSIAKKYGTKLRSLTRLFDDLLLSLRVPESLLPLVNRISRLILRRVHDNEQTQELRGISKTIDVPMYLLIALNVVLDLLMGCTSGGALSREPRRPQSTARMLHFRTLDWGMDPLRKVIVQLDFVRSASENPSQIIASSITYVGFVGVLTGVKPGLSMSLNFRAVHDASTRKEQFQYYFHHLKVLLGRKPSIASLLRSYLLPPDNVQNFKNYKESIDDDSGLAELTLADQACAQLISSHTTAAYVVFSDGKQTHIIEKDYNQSQIASSTTFIARTNHDVCAHPSTSSSDGFSADLAPKVAIAATDTDTNGNGGPVGLATTGLEGLLSESKDRLECLESKWVSRMQKLSARARRENSRTTYSEQDVYVSKDELVKWVSAYTTTNECTHFATIMDPIVGQVVWCQAYPKPLQGPTVDDTPPRL